MLYLKLYENEIYELSMTESRVICSLHSLLTSFVFLSIVFEPIHWYKNTDENNVTTIYDMYTTSMENCGVDQYAKMWILIN